MGVLWAKILRDLWSQKGRTLQVVLIIGIGAAAIGMIMTTRNLIIPEMARMWQATNPATIHLFVGPPVTSDELLVLKKTPGVKDLEGLNVTTVEYRLHPDEDWKQGNLNARGDYEDQRIFTLDLVEGAWPAGRVVAIGQDAEAYFGSADIEQVTLRVNDREHEIQIDGAIYNIYTQPANFGGTAQFYASKEYFERLVGNRDFSQVWVTTEGYSEESAQNLADRLQETLEKQGKASGRLINNPAKMQFQDQLDGVFLLLGVLSLLSLLLGLLLVYNTINSLIAQQVDQIGVMKAIGARTWQILRLFLINIFAYSILALMLALPVGILGGWGISFWLITTFGADPGSFSYSPPAITTLVVIAVIAPLVAAFFPILSASRTTVRDAISTYGLSKGTSLLDRILSQARHISRLVLITISNTFRRKRRVVMLQISLVLSGLIFMMVISVRDSVMYTFRDVLFSILNADIRLFLEEPERIEGIEKLTLAHPGVEAVEMWGATSATIRPAGQEESEDDEAVTMLGVPLPTDLYRYQLNTGRWLNPQDNYAAVLNLDLARDVGVGVGDWVTFQYGERRSRDWLIVGLVFDPLNPGLVTVPREVLLRDLNQVGRASSIWIRAADNNPQSHIAVAKDLRAYFEKNHIEISPQRGFQGGDTSGEAVTTIVTTFNFIVVLLAIMAVVIGTVGSIALSGALSLSVLERRREIGVMRAIGASSWTLARMFIGEGLILGWLSWLISLPLSLPAGRVMVSALSDALDLELLYKFTPLGPCLWLVVITILSILASWFPARGAIRISVRESLAYQ